MLRRDILVVALLRHALGGLDGLQCFLCKIVGVHCDFTSYSVVFVLRWARSPFPKADNSGAPRPGTWTCPWDSPSCTRQRAWCSPKAPPPAPRTCSPGWGWRCCGQICRRTGRNSPARPSAAGPGSCPPHTSTGGRTPSWRQSATPTGCGRSPTARRWTAPPCGRAPPHILPWGGIYIPDWTLATWWRCWGKKTAPDPGRASSVPRWP